MRREHVPGGGIILHAESRRDLRKLAVLAATGKIDPGMDVRGFNKKTNVPMREVVIKLPNLLIETEGDCTWITKDGVHICIGGDGVITKGPAHLVGKKLNAEDHSKLKEFISKLPDRVSDPDKWSRSEFLDKNPVDDPNVQKFVKAVDGFTDGKYDTLTKVTEQLNKGDEQGALKLASTKTRDSYASAEQNEEIAKTTLEHAKLINAAVKNADPRDVHVWRGIGADRKLDTFEALKAGDVMDIAGVKSFSWDKSVAVEYAQRNGQFYYFLEIQGPTKGVSIPSISQMPREQEFMSQGRFVIDSVETTSAATKIFKVHQKALFGSGISEQVLLEADSGTGHWITVNGHHIMIGGQKEFSFMSQIRKDNEARPPKASASAKEEETHLKNAVVSSSDSLGGGVSETIKVEFEDGTSGVFKPSEGESEDARNDISNGYQTEREVGAWEVAKLVGMDDLVTPAVKYELDGREGALLAWRDGELAKNIYPDSDAFDGKTDLQRSAAFDYVIGNEDRHQGNWLVEGGKLQLIDHGLSFPDKGDNGALNRRFLARAVQEYGKEEIGKEFVEPYVKAKNQIMESLTDLGLPKSSVDGVGRRIDELSQADTWGKLAEKYSIWYPGVSSDKSDSTASSKSHLGNVSPIDSHPEDDAVRNSVKNLGRGANPAADSVFRQHPDWVQKSKPDGPGS